MKSILTLVSLLQVALTYAQRPSDEAVYASIKQKHIALLNVDAIIE